MNLADIQAKKALKLAKENYLKTGYSFNTLNGLKRWRAEVSKLKAGKTGIINLNILGTSISEGVGSSDYPSGLTKGYVGRLRSALAAKFGDVGYGFNPIYFPSTSPKFTYGGSGWYQTLTSFGVHGKNSTTATNGDTLSFTFSGTELSLLVVKNNGLGQFTVSIDGGAATTYDTHNVGGLMPAVLIQVATGLSDATHTLTLTKTNDGKSITILGACASKGITGVRVNNMGLNSSTISSCYSSGKYWLEPEIDVWTPKLTIIEHFCNDQYYQTPLDTYKNTLQTVISRALQFGDVLLLADGVWDSAHLSTPLTQAHYLDVLKRLAVTNNCALVDVYNRWGANGDYANNTLGLHADQVHPNDYGSYDIFQALINVLSEDR